MGMRVSLAFFFSFAFEGKAKKNRTSALAELTENVESGPHFSFFFWFLNLEQVLGLAYRKCGERGDRDR